MLQGDRVEGEGESGGRGRAKRKGERERANGKGKNGAAKTTVTAVLPSIERVTSDAELVERARGGDAAAFGELVERHRGAVYRAALAALRNPADAEDVAQDALVRAYRKIDQFRADASIRTWMVTIGWRLAADRRRRPLRRLKQLLMVDDHQAATFESDAPSPERCAIDAERLRDVRNRIRRLPAKLRDALLLVAAGDLTQDEIAAALNVNPTTFRSRVLEARRRLKERDV